MGHRETCTNISIMHLDVDILCAIILTRSWSFVLLNDTWSQLGHSVSCMPIFFSFLTNYQSKHQVTSKISCKLGDCR